MTCLAVMQMSNQRDIPDEVGIVHYVRQKPSHTYTEPHKPRHLASPTAWSAALAWHPRTYPLQRGSHSALLSAVQGSWVPGRLLYTSLSHYQSTSFNCCQPQLLTVSASVPFVFFIFCTVPLQYLWHDSVTLTSTLLLTCYRAHTLQWRCCTN